MSERHSEGEQAERVRRAKIAQQIRQAAEALHQAYDTDEEYWSELMCGQDTEEAEASGYLGGYRDALEAVGQLLAGNSDTLAGFVASTKETAAEQLAELAERSLDA